MDLYVYICVFCTVRVWYVPNAYGTYHTRTVRFSVPYTVKNGLCLTHAYRVVATRPPAHTYQCDGLAIQFCVAATRVRVRYPV